MQNKIKILAAEIVIYILGQGVKKTPSTWAEGKETYSTICSIFNQKQINIFHLTNSLIRLKCIISLLCR